MDKLLGFFGKPTGAPSPGVAVPATPSPPSLFQSVPAQPAAATPTPTSFFQKMTKVLKPSAAVYSVEGAETCGRLNVEVKTGMPGIPITQDKFVTEMTKFITTAIPALTSSQTEVTGMCTAISKAKLVDNNDGNTYSNSRFDALAHYLVALIFQSDPICFSNNGTGKKCAWDNMILQHIETDIVIMNIISKSDVDKNNKLIDNMVTYISDSSYRSSPSLPRCIQFTQNINPSRLVASTNGKQLIVLDVPRYQIKFWPFVCMIFIYVAYGAAAERTIWYKVGSMFGSSKYQDLLDHLLSSFAAVKVTGGAPSVGMKCKPPRTRCPSTQRPGKTRRKL